MFRNKSKTTLLEQKKDLDSQELQILAIEMEKQKKNPTAMWLIWLFFGSIGGHKYYLGKYFNAILHTLVFILMASFSFNLVAGATTAEDVMYTPFAVVLALGIPAFWALVDALAIGRLLAEKNEKVEMEIIDQIKKMRAQ